MMVSNESAFVDYYKILEIAPNSSPVQIRSAVKKQSLNHHPDRGGDHEKQILINKAGSLLSNPVERENYDRYYRSVKSPAKTAARTTPDTHQPRQAYSASNTRKSAFDNIYSRINRYYDELIVKERNSERATKERLLRTIQNSYTSWKRSTKKVYDQKWKAYVLMYRSRINLKRIFIRRSLVIGITSLLVLYFTILTRMAYFQFWGVLLYFFFGLLMISAILAMKALSLNWMAVEGENLKIESDATIARIKSCLVERLKVERFSYQNLSLLYIENKWPRRIMEHIDHNIGAQVRKVINSKQLDRERYLSTAKRIFDVLDYDSTFDTSEQQVARRITATLFIMGFTPIRYDSQFRMITFTDGVENLLIRFRHRTGRRSNISYVRRMVEKMQSENIASGLIFCTPGLSENGRVFAHKHNVKWYSLEKMNDWIKNVVNGDYQGPSANFLSNLEVTEQFLNQLSLRITGRK